MIAKHKPENKETFKLLNRKSKEGDFYLMTLNGLCKRSENAVCVGKATLNLKMSV